MLTLRKLEKYLPAAKLLLVCLTVLSLAHPVPVDATPGLRSRLESGAIRIDPAALLIPAQGENPRKDLLSIGGRCRDIALRDSGSGRAVPLKGASTPVEENSTPARFEHHTACHKPAEDNSRAGENSPAGSVPSDPAEPAPESPPAKIKSAAGAALPSRGQSPEAEEKPAQPSPPQPVTDDDTALNSYVQQVITTYHGYYPYLLNTDYANYNGVSENLYFENRLLAKAHPSGNRATHCVGITFEVFFKAMQARNQKLGLAADDFNEMTFEDLYDFLLIWYAAGGKQVHNIEVAVEKYGLGKRIDRFEEARAGDFMDISRTNGTGHTVVFQNWIRSDSGEITGIRYWSSQNSGAGFNTEYFVTGGRGNVCSSPVYIARVLPVHQYKSFR